MLTEEELLKSIHDLETDNIERTIATKNTDKFGEATPENFPMQNSYRNPVIAEAMKVLGYVNKFGRGVLRAQEALFQNGNPLPEYDFQSNYFLTTTRSTT